MYAYLTRNFRSGKNNPIFRQLLQTIIPEHLRNSIENTNNGIIKIKTDNNTLLTIDTNLNVEAGVRIFSETKDSQNRTYYSCSILSSIGLQNDIKYSSIEIIRDGNNTLFSTLTIDYLNGSIDPANIKIYNTILDNHIIKDFDKVVQSLRSRNTTIDFANNVNFTSPSLTDRNDYYYRNQCQKNESYIGVDYRTTDIGGVLLLQSPNGIWTLLESQPELTEQYKEYFIRIQREVTKEKLTILNLIGKEIDDTIEKVTGRSLIYSSDFIQELEKDRVSYNVFDTIAFLEKNGQKKAIKTI